MAARRYLNLVEVHNALLEVVGVAAERTRGVGDLADA